MMMMMMSILNIYYFLAPNLTNYFFLGGLTAKQCIAIFSSLGRPLLFSHFVEIFGSYRLHQLHFYRLDLNRLRQSQAKITLKYVFAAHSLIAFLMYLKSINLRENVCILILNSYYLS